MHDKLYGLIGIGGAGLAGMAWVADQLNWGWPKSLIYCVGIISVLMIFYCFNGLIPPSVKKKLDFFSIDFDMLLLWALPLCLVFIASLIAINKQYLFQKTQNLDMDFRIRTPSFFKKNLSQKKDVVWFQHVVITNRSERNMSLVFLLSIEVEDNDGRLSHFNADGKLFGINETISMKRNILFLEKDSTFEGNIVFELPSTHIMDIPKWDIEFTEDKNLLMIYDRVTGIRVWCNPSIGYPPAKKGRGFSCTSPIFR